MKKIRLLQFFLLGLGVLLIPHYSRASAPELFNTSLFSDPNLKVYFRFGEARTGSTAIVDSTGQYGGSASLSNMSLRSDGLFATSTGSTATDYYTLNGTGSGNLGDNTSDGAYSFWFQNTATPSGYASCGPNQCPQALAGKGNVYLDIGLSPTSTLDVAFYDGTVPYKRIVGSTVIASTTSAGAWHQVVFTYDGSGSDLYLDGVLETHSALTPRNMDSGANGNSIYVHGDGLGASTIGSVDDFAFFNRKLTQADVDILNQTPHPPSEFTGQAVITYYPDDANPNPLSPGVYQSFYPFHYWYDGTTYTGTNVIWVLPQDTATITEDFTHFDYKLYRTSSTTTEEWNPPKTQRSLGLWHSYISFYTDGSLDTLITTSSLISWTITTQQILDNSSTPVYAVPTNHLSYASSTIPCTESSNFFTAPVSTVSCWADQAILFGANLLFVPGSGATDYIRNDYQQLQSVFPFSLAFGLESSLMQSASSSVPQYASTTLSLPQIGLSMQLVNSSTLVSALTNPRCNATCAQGEHDNLFALWDAVIWIGAVFWAKLLILG